MPTDRRETWCPQCGPGVACDEDGCCVSCGATAMGRGAARACELLRREAWRRRRRTRDREAAKIARRTGITLIEVPAGEFEMGSPDGEGDSDEHPAHRVRLDRFWLGKYPVMNAEYGKFLAAVPGARRPRYLDDERFNGPDQPVVGVLWDEAVEFCKWAGMRLPTEAEWEYAARGTDGRRYPWGNDAPTPERANFGDNVNRSTAVGSYPMNPSPFGLFDMAGNVWEWTADWYAERYYAKAPRENPKGPATGSARVIRGGSWCSDAKWLRAASRNWYEPEYWFDFLGFRCAREEDGLARRTAEPELQHLYPCALAQR